MLEDDASNIGVAFVPIYDLVRGSGGEIGVAYNPSARQTQGGTERKAWRLSKLLCNGHRAHTKAVGESAASYTVVQMTAPSAWAWAWEEGFEDDVDAVVQSTAREVYAPTASLPEDSRVPLATNVPSTLDMFAPATRRATPAETRVIASPAPLPAAMVAGEGANVRMKQSGLFLLTATSIPADDDVHHEMPSL